MCNYYFYLMPLTCPYIFNTLCDKIFIAQIKNAYGPCACVAAKTK